MVSGGVVYDSSAHAFISASSQYESADEPPGGPGGKGGKALWSAPGEYEYHFTLHPLDSREMHPSPSRMRVKFVVEMQLSEREMLSEPVPVRYLCYLVITPSTRARCSLNPCR